jgi:hypothetical protein
MIPVDLEKTQEIARVAFAPADPLEQTQPIYPNHQITGTWEPMRRLTPMGEWRTLERYRK